ncbi:hypothetical protein BVI2075_370058 [Burkholderia vietnamiensis]|nr:hypothetical protein BVI2075_370058 [Burkholderia vietnamiensis]
MRDRARDVRTDALARAVYGAAATNGQFGRVARRGGDSVEKGAWGDGRRIGLTARTGQGDQAGDARDAEDAARRSTTRARGDPPANAAGRACLPPDA